LINLINNNLIVGNTVLGKSAGFLVFIDVVVPFIIIPVSQFLTVMTLLYLFYYQGMQMIRHHKAATTPKFGGRQKVKSV
jgi:hypothetical protein